MLKIYKKIEILLNIININQTFKKLILIILPIEILKTVEVLLEAVNLLHKINRLKKEGLRIALKKLKNNG
jgi:hypothetical protein